MSDTENILKDLLSSQYRIVQKLGEGSQGTVYLAEDLHSGKKVAIKQLLIQSVKDWKLYDLFHREADTLKRLDVSGVAKLYEARDILDIETPMAIIVQDYIEGEPLQKFIAQGHRFRIEQIGEILYQMLAILEKLHHANPPVIHRDLKPSNIILNYTDESTTPDVHIIDFGAVSNPQVKGGGSTVVGTYGYMAPEQLMGTASAASDLYSLAIIAVYLMSGVAPENYEIDDFHVLIDPHLEHLPHVITQFLHQMLEPRQEDRMTDYQTIRQFFDALRTQHFERISAPASTAMAVSAKNGLSQVKCYRQAGNIELWHALSDITPRSIPFAIRKKINQIVFKKKLLTCLGYTCAVIILSICILNCFNDESLYITLVPCLFFLIIAAIVGGYRSIKNESFNILTQYRLWFRLNAFMKNARKSMATIIRIEYMPIYPTLNKRNEIYGSYQPTWRLTYSFNPPDDSSPDPIVHEVQTHTLPKYIKEGDLIPILYSIDQVDGKERVSSTPYPIPAEDKFALYSESKD